MIALISTRLFEDWVWRLVTLLLRRCPRPWTALSRS